MTPQELQAATIMRDYFIKLVADNSPKPIKQVDPVVAAQIAKDAKTDRLVERWHRALHVRLNRRTAESWLGTHHDARILAALLKCTESSKRKQMSATHCENYVNLLLNPSNTTLQDEEIGHDNSVWQKAESHT